MERIESGGVHPLAEFVAWLVHAGCVDKRDLSPLKRDDSEKGVTGGLGKGGHDCQRLSQGAIEECRLADVRAADEGYSAKSHDGGGVMPRRGRVRKQPFTYFSRILANSGDRLGSVTVDGSGGMAKE